MLTLLHTFTPGAAMFGLISHGPKAEAPRLEKLAMTLEMLNAPAL